MAEIDFLCLANSKMLNGRCIAGINLDSGKWIRLVSGLPTHAYSLEETQLDNEKLIRPLDVARVAIGPTSASISQPENVLADGGSWKFVRQLNTSEGPDRKILRQAMRLGGTFMNIPNPGASAIPVGAGDINSSLALILVKGPTFQQYNPGTIRCYFSFEDAVFDLPFTDDLQEFGFSQRSWKQTFSQSFLFTISLGQPFKDSYWKILASAIALND